MDLSAHYSPIARAMEQNPLRPNWAVVRPEVLSLAYGFPDADSFPYDAIEAATARLMRARSAAALQYGPVAGPAPLREFVAAWLNQTEHLGVAADNIIITSGASQAIVLSAQLLVPSGGAVIVEDPTFIGALWFLRSLGLQIEGVPMDAQGLRPDALRDAVQRLRAGGRSVSLVYTMPTVHNPAGIDASAARRAELAAVAQELDLVFLEDDAYGDLRFDGARPASLYQVAGSMRVIKLGTLSKLVAGGMRLGWAVAAPADIARMCSLKSDAATSPFAAWVAAEYLKTGALARRVPELRALYQRRRDVMLASLAPLADLGCTWSRPSGGFFVWLTLPAGTDAEALRLVAESHGVTYLPGHHCFASGAGRRHVRLAYSYLRADEIRESAARLVRALHEALAPVRAR
ncbi:MAG: PLP-dependent aminotransferase family protein [Actinobacteria bacterium]|nr:PLP-dependent aminotransferase family protein [Actinomycetota bacterium]